MDTRPLSNRKILLIVGGGIAAYKALELVRLIAKAGGWTRVILTESGAEFVTPLSLAALSGHPVRSGLFHPDDETGGLEYNDAIPALIGQLLPEGVLGIALTGLFASFMAGVAANVSSLNTVVTYDLLEPYLAKFKKIERAHV